MEEIKTPETRTPNLSQEEKETENKKPSKMTRKERINTLIRKINNDSIHQVMEDIIAENKRLRRELENLRIQNTTIKRDYEELMHSLLRDRLNNQNLDSDF